MGWSDIDVRASRKARAAQGDEDDIVRQEDDFRRTAPNA
jgi:hypothetical protein